MFYSFFHFFPENWFFILFHFVPGKGIFMPYKFSHLRTKYLIRKNTYFSDRRFLQCADFAKSLGRKIRFGLWFYLNQSSEADIQPSLYNQTLSIIFQASQFSRILCFWEFRISGFSVFNFYRPDIDLHRKFLKYEILKNIKF